MADVTISGLSVNTSLLSATNYIPVSDGINTTSIGTNSLFGFRNRIINGNFNINQRAASIGTTNTYGFDRWLTANQSTTTTFTQQVDQANGIPVNIRVSNGATAQRFGLLQYIESGNCKDLRGKQVTLSFLVRAGGGNPSLRIGIIEWNGTADTITTPIITSYGQVPPATAANSILYSSVVSTVQGAWTPVSFTYTAGSTFNNLIVYILTNSSVASRDLDITNVQLEEGSTATPFQFRPIGTELALCQRYFEKSSFMVNNDGAVYTNYFFKSCMRNNPVVTTTPTITVNNSSPFGFYLSPQGGGGALGGIVISASAEL